MCSTTDVSSISLLHFLLSPIRISFPFLPIVVSLSIYVMVPQGNIFLGIRRLKKINLCNQDKIYEDASDRLDLD
jgi:hypothetical protein